MIDLKNKLAVVTGATGGIGEAIVKSFHQHGAKVVMVGRRKEKLEELATKFGAKAHPEICDFNNMTEVANLIPKIQEKYGNIDILVCNAGITKDTLALRMSDDQWDDVIKLNLSVNFHLNRNAIKFMMKQKYGKIINITSIVGQTGNIGQCNYAASKAGIIAMSKSLALEVASRGININCVAPGYIDTPMTSVLSDAVKEAVLAKIPLKRIGHPEDIANATTFLAADCSSYITGHTLNVNGGMLML
jgi:3-oxoacyl-[acyl-carrier protein] reductase